MREKETEAARHHPAHFIGAAVDRPHVDPSIHYVNRGELRSVLKLEHWAHVVHGFGAAHLDDADRFGVRDFLPDGRRVEIVVHGACVVVPHCAYLHIRPP
jgi:hypothetical protein